jgi:hypothetical protein
MKLAQHDLHFTIGENVGQQPVSDSGLRWHYTPPVVALDEWPVTACEPDSPYTTVTHWGGKNVRFQGEEYRNGKRDGFLPFVELPRRVRNPLELAVHFGAKYDQDRRMFEDNGWHLREPDSISATPWDYQRYIQSSAGEFSCAKPSYVRLENAWISDRTLCFLASGKPAVVQYTGKSEFLDDRSGLLRFRTPDEAAACLEIAAKDYHQQSQLARQLAEEHFDARKVAQRVLEIAL